MCSRHMGVCMDIAMANGELTQVVVFLAGFAPDHQAAPHSPMLPLSWFLQSQFTHTVQWLPENFFFWNILRTFFWRLSSLVPFMSSYRLFVPASTTGHETSSPTRNWSSPGLWVAALLIIGPHSYSNAVNVWNRPCLVLCIRKCKEILTANYDIKQNQFTKPISELPR